MLERNKIFRRLIHRKTLACSNKFCNYPNPDLLIESTTTVGLATQAHKDQLLCCYTASANLKSTSTLKCNLTTELLLPSVEYRLVSGISGFCLALECGYGSPLWICVTHDFTDRTG
ncbi:uncharacterized protein PHA67_008847 isoform 1-T1 [Liasis olivaceus]